MAKTIRDLELELYDKTKKIVRKPLSDEPLLDSFRRYLELDEEEHESDSITEDEWI